MSKQNVRSDVSEAVSKMKEWRSFYRAVRKLTGSREQAEKALRYVVRLSEEAGLE